MPSATAVLAASFIGPMQVAGRLIMVTTDRFFTHHRFALLAFASMGVAVSLLLLISDTKMALVAFVTLFGSAWGN